jgi:hypothetical protein
VHVCRKWRNVVLESPLRLNLRIRCPTKRVREKLDIWPDLPIVLVQNGEDFQQNGGVATVAAAFEQNNRISHISLWCVPTLEMEEILAAMHKPSPVLTHLDLGSDDDSLETPLDPDLFLGGSAPCLRFLHLAYIPFPGLPKLLLSASHLTNLRFSRSGYISPEAIVSRFSALTRLETLVLEFGHPESDPRRPPRSTRTLLPALTQLHFMGSANIWRISWAGSMPLNWTTLK